jgi:hypothetical protein
MTKKAHDIDVFDRAYRDRVCDAVWKAIVEAVRDPATGISPLRNYEVYDALLQIQAMILASSKESGSPAKLRSISDDFSRRLRRLVADLRKTYARDGAPFDVIHTDKMQ